MKEEREASNEGGSEVNAGYFDEVESFDKRWESIQEGKFQKNWGREIPI